MSSFAAVGSRPRSQHLALDTGWLCYDLTTMCTGMRIVRAWSAISLEVIA